MKNNQEECLWLMYINKAIVEEQAEERGAHPGLPVDGRLHLGFDGGVDVGTRFRVKIGGELSIGPPHEEEQDARQSQDGHRT